jgi:hypothetical protein
MWLAARHGAAIARRTQNGTRRSSAAAAAARTTPRASAPDTKTAVAYRPNKGAKGINTKANHDGPAWSSCMSPHTMAPAIQMPRTRLLMASPAQRKTTPATRAASPLLRAFIVWSAGAGGGPLWRPASCAASIRRLPRRSVPWPGAATQRRTARTCPQVRFPRDAPSMSIMDGRRTLRRPRAMAAGARTAPWELADSVAVPEDRDERQGAGE